MKRIKILVNEIIVPIIIAASLALLFRSVYVSENTINYFLAWIIIGVPFGIKRMWAWIIPSGYDLGATIGVVVFNFIIGGIIGGFVLLWQIGKGVVKLIAG